MMPINWEQLAQDYQLTREASRVASPRGYYHTQATGPPILPNSLSLRPYQQDAVANWLHHRGRGILKMATGSGKTFVALAIATELYQKIGLQVLLVLCPYRHLVTQWAKECEKFNLRPLLAFETVRHWHNALSTQLYNVQSGQQSFLTVITTNSSFIGEGFQSQLKFFPEKTLIVGDEAHHLGSPGFEASLPNNIGLRLALSATPERYFDEDGTEALINYFGEVLQPEFTLKDALEQKALVNYFYYPLFVELTASESLDYAKLTKRIGWALGENDNFANDTVTALLMQRSRLVGTAANKLQALRDLMSQRLETSHTLFYCGDGVVDDGYRQVAAVTRILGVELGYRVNTYTVNTPMVQRERLRQQFETGELQGLVAIHCLDEGVDIPAIRNAVILASTSNPRQFIQRRGRILRPHPQKEYATLYDMIVLPPQLDREVWEVERTLLRKELNRFIEFAILAQNAQDAQSKLMMIQEKYGL